ncbi:MAG: hypothetical protein ACM3ZF_05170 [Mycobacterium leprae]
MVEVAETEAARVVSLISRFTPSVPALVIFGFEEAEHLGPPGVDGLRQGGEFGHVDPGAPGVEPVQAVAMSERCPPRRAVASRARSSSLPIHAASSSPDGSASTSSFHG